MVAAKTVEDYLKANSAWRAELTILRKILLTFDMQETVKWGMPVYVANGRNVVGISSFKSYFGLWFFEGAALSDKDNILINAQEGKTKLQRQWRMTSGKELRPRLIKSYIREAINHVENTPPLKVTPTAGATLPPELTRALGENAAAKKAFKALTPGKQREYAAHIADAKRAETKQKRLQKIIPMIIDGAGLSDRYR